jgi:hypothetical protein
MPDSVNSFVAFIGVSAFAALWMCLAWDAYQESKKAP